jgi:two-component system sensor histidine kinase EvgS
MRQGKLETGVKVLVVADDNALRGVVAKMLSLLGYEVSSADSGENGLNHLSRSEFDVVLSDCVMPVMDGIAFARSVKRKSLRTRVVIMTGGLRETVLPVAGTVVDEVISKPFSFAELDETIRNLSDARARRPPFHPGQTGHGQLKN